MTFFLPGLRFSAGRTQLIMASVAMMLTACASNVLAPWSHPQQSADRFEEERLFCETVARSQVIRPEAPPPAINFTGLATVIKMVSESNLNRDYEAEVLRQTQECLKKKGWKPPA